MLINIEVAKLFKLGLICL